MNPVGPTPVALSRYDLERGLEQKGAQRPVAASVPRKHGHYFKPCPYREIDVYRVIELWRVTDPCLQHALKKVLLAGGRGQKDADKDVQEAIDTLRRWQEMRAEEKANG